MDAQKRLYAALISQQARHRPEAVKAVHVQRVLNVQVGIGYVGVGVSVPLQPQRPVFIGTSMRVPKNRSAQS